MVGVVASVTDETRDEAAEEVVEAVELPALSETERAPPGVRLMMPFPPRRGTAGDEGVELERVVFFCFIALFVAAAGGETADPRAELCAEVVF